MGILQNWIDGFKPHEDFVGKKKLPSINSDTLSLDQDDYKNDKTDAFDNADEQRPAVYSTEDANLKRKLQGRHIQFIALGGSIGTGLFIGSSSPLVDGGPGSLVIGFLTISILVITVVYALGELASVLPVTGAFSTYATRFIDPSWGFAMGYIYWIGWITPLPLEAIAAAMVIQYWDPDETVPRGVWVAISISIVLFINIFGVRGYGEFEFAASFIKVIGCIGFIICAVVIDCGGAPSGRYLGAHTWHDPGAFNNGFKGFCSVFTTAAFAFAGTELVGLAAAETKDARKQLPRACKQVVFRVLLFYILSLFMISLIVPSNDPRLEGGEYDTRTSPFVLAIKIGGIKKLPSIFNAIILLSTLSVGNASVYAASRTLLALANHNQAPKIFRYVDRNGRPLPAVVLSLLFGPLGFLIYSASETEIFNWFVSLAGFNSVFAWISICYAHIRFRAAWLREGNSLEDLPWASPLGVIGSWVGFAFNLLVIVGTFYVSAFPIGEGEMTARERAHEFFLGMISMIFVIVLYLGHKLITRSHFVRDDELDIHTGRREPVSREVLEQERAEERARPLWSKALSFIF